MNKQPLIVIAGPTASGKTALGIEICKLYNGEVVSADSMQIYKGMDIATAKPSIEEMNTVKHHLIGFVNCDCKFSVADYVTKARETISEISSRGKLPVVVGGTGLYINSLIDNIKFNDMQSDNKIRAKYFNLASEYGNEYILKLLSEVDNETASQLHANNVNRIVRALEVYEMTGIPLSVHKVNSRLDESPYNVCYIGLDFMDRQKLYDRINDRVDLMVKNGLITEAEETYKLSNSKTSAQAIGHKELIPYLEHQQSLEECIEILKQQTRRYAKRQLTWFRRDKRINWIYIDKYMDNQKIILAAKKIIENSSIL